MKPRVSRATGHLPSWANVATDFCMQCALPVASLLFVCGGLLGCRQGVYSARSLPPNLAAQTVVDIRQFDLSRLGGGTVAQETILPGDILQVSLVTGGEDTVPAAWQARVGEDGAAELPLVGPVQLAGLNIASAETRIRDASMHRRVFRRPAVSVAISDRRLNRVTVTGAVKSPGTYQLPASSSSLANALFAAGGLSEDANLLIQIRQPQIAGNPMFPQHDFASWQAPPPQQELQIDLRQAIAAGTQGNLLADGAVVNVTQRPDRFVQLTGLTGNRILELPHNRDVRVLDALAEAGGPRYSNWIVDKVKVYRTVPGSNKTATIKVSIRKAKRDVSANILLASGDIVSVEENPMTFTLGTLGKLIGIGSTAATGAAVGF